jgi:ferredoxin-NADP reductase
VSGQALSVSAPRNHFPLASNAQHSVLFAGGIGITPIWAMLQHLKARSQNWELHYASRSRDDMAFRDELQQLPGAHLHFDDENAGRVLDLNAVVSKAPTGAHFYCCGPVPMLDAFRAATAALPSGQVHFEYFAAKEERSLDGGFVVELARSKKEVLIPPGRSILEVLRDEGLDVSSSCEEGICGICETAVISGVPDHRDAILSDHERATNKVMMICCSGSKTARLVLDK